MKAIVWIESQMDSRARCTQKSRDQIYQIYYSEETRNRLDSGFIPLDNCGQPPDWREYLPMRKVLLGNALDEGALYGFFSTKFQQKTRLDSGAVYAFLADLKSPVDVVSFSPFFDQAAFHLNTFEQAVGNHPNIWATWDVVMARLAPDIDPRKVVMDARQSIFCNFFVARPKFWRDWLEKCELIYAAAEDRTDPLCYLLNQDVPYNDGFMPAKVFVIERMVSLLLVSNPAWRVANYNPMQLPLTGAEICRFPADLIAMDALKQSANVTHHEEYIRVFWNLRTAVTNAMSSK